MATNNNGNLLDTAGNVVVDFAWGNFPMQPNDERTSTADFTTAPSTVVSAANATGNYGWSGYTVYPSSRLNPTLSNHNVAEAKYAGFPDFESGDGAYISGVAYISVPSVLGETTALALDELRDAGYESANITTASAATNTAVQITTVNATTTTSATLTIAGGTTAWPVGTKVTITAGTGIPTALVGTFSVTGGSGSTIIVSGTGFTVANSGAITPGATLKGTVGTIKTQSTAAAAASVLSTATITVTPWAA